MKKTLYEQLDIQETASHEVNNIGLPKAQPSKSEQLVLLQKMTDGPTYYSEVREERTQQWKESLRKSDDLTLIASFNGGVGIRAWGTARADYLNCLIGEIKRRDFDSSNVFTLDIYQDGIIHEGFSLRRKVKLENGKLVFIDNAVLGDQ
jgi:hypothetical protein